ncbi:hypothetical protein CLV80_1031 [Yoonia maritima]|uniref:O-antigen ligase n=1 Tax=Yoonia maritima TaxID=1435347 RepID=A0A2T0W138_9RHOB|nr:hypothetical protein [Yoonia maritima]PRY78680.1 hypothetical protein CLV80_1031 [Yoonia maritima]
MINVILAGHALFVLAFDYVPEGLASAISGALMVGYVSVALINFGRGRHLDVLKFALPIWGISICWIIGSLVWANDPTPFPPSMLVGVRQGSVFFMFLGILAGRSQISARLLKWILYIFIASALGHALLLPKEILNFSPRFAPFTAGLHTTGYILVILMLAAFTLHRQHEVSRNIFIVICGALIFLIIGNGVRTPILFLIIIVGLQVFRDDRNRLGVSPYLYIVAGFVLAAFTAFFVFGDVNELSQFSSGRIPNYAERLTRIYQRGVPTFLFGTGPGTDLLRTGIWWWDYKDSHSDILKYIWESGLFGALVVAGWFYLGSSYKRGNLFAPFAALALTSCISNALLVRPNAIFLFFAVICYSLAMKELSEEKAKALQRELG